MKYDWLRLHHDIWGDEKMHALSDVQFRLWVGMLVLASQGKPRGVISGLGGRAAQARRLYTTEQELGTALALFAGEAYQMVTLPDDGTIVVTHWANRQYDKPSDVPEATRERKRNQRDRRQEGEVPARPKAPAGVPAPSVGAKSHAIVTRTSRARHATDTESSSNDDEQRQNDVANATSTDPEPRDGALTPTSAASPSPERADGDDGEVRPGDHVPADHPGSLASVVTDEVTDLWQRFDAWKALRPGEFLRRLESEYPAWLPYLGRLLHDAKAAKRSRGESKIHLEVPYLKGIALDYLPDILAGKCPPPEGDSSSDGQHEAFAGELAPNGRGAPDLGGAAGAAPSGGRERSGPSVGGAAGRGRAGAAHYSPPGARSSGGIDHASGGSKRRYTSADAKPF